MLWNVDTLEKIGTFAEHEAAIAAISYSPDGRNLAAVGFEEKLRIYDAVTGELARELACPGGDMRTRGVFARRFDAGRRRPQRRDSRLEHGRRRRGSQPRSAPAARVRVLAFSPDGRQLVSCSEDRTVQVWNIVGDGEVSSLAQRGSKAQSIAFVGPEKLAVGGSDNTIRLWDLATKAEIDQLVGHTGSVVALAHRDTRLVSGSYDTSVRVWTVDFNAANRSASPLRAQRTQSKKGGGANPRACIATRFTPPIELPFQDKFPIMNCSTL